MLNDIIYKFAKLIFFTILESKKFINSSYSWQKAKFFRILSFKSINPEYLMSPTMMFSVKSYKSILLDLIKQENFLKQFIIPFNDSKIPIIRQTISSISTEYDSMIAREILGKENKYEIYENFLNYKN